MPEDKADNTHLTATTAPEGYKKMPPVLVLDGHTVTIQERNGSKDPEVWISVAKKGKDGKVIGESATISLNDAKRISEQLDFLVKNHTLNIRKRR